MLRLSGIRFAQPVELGSRDWDRFGDTNGSIGSHTMSVEGLHIFQPVEEDFMSSLALDIPLMLLPHPSAHCLRFVIDKARSSHCGVVWLLERIELTSDS